MFHIEGDAVNELTGEGFAWLQPLFGVRLEDLG